LYLSPSPPLPQHIAIIMDGNRRWAKKRYMPAALGHAAGAQRVRDIVKTCGEIGIPQLSLFAFSTENWKRPEEEVSSLMGLFTTYLKKEIRNMNANGVRLKVLGDTSRFSPALQTLIADAQAQTANNQVITLNYANAAMEAKSYRLALHLLKSLLYYQNDNFLAYEMLTQAYRGLNEMARYYEARADLFYQLANYEKAIEDLNMALNQLDSHDKLENRRLEAKKKQLQTELNRLKKLN